MKWIIKSQFHSIFNQDGITNSPKNLQFQRAKRVKLAHLLRSLKTCSSVTENILNIQRQVFCHLQKQENRRQIENKNEPMKEMLAFFPSPEKQRPPRTTLMTSSKRQRGQRAVPHLVLCTNLKKIKDTTQQTREGRRRSRGGGRKIKKQGCEFWRRGASGGSGS